MDLEILKNGERDEHERKKMRSWLVEYRPKCGCTALKEPVDCGQGFRVYAESIQGEITSDWKAFCRNCEKIVAYGHRPFFPSEGPPLIRRWCVDGEHWL